MQKKEKVLGLRGAAYEGNEEGVEPNIQLFVTQVAITVLQHKGLVRKREPRCGRRTNVYHRRERAELKETGPGDGLGGRVQGQDQSLDTQYVGRVSLHGECL